MRKTIYQVGILGALVGLAGLSSQARPSQIIATGDNNPTTSTYEYDVSRPSDRQRIIDGFAAATTNPIAITNESVIGGVAPHHFPTALPVLVDFYRQLAIAQAPELIVIIGPDHRSKAEDTLVTTDGTFLTPFGSTTPAKSVTGALIADDQLTFDRPVFADEHSIGVHMPFLQHLFPGVPILPILVHPHATSTETSELGTYLASHTPPSTLMIASVDFSHYLPADQARLIDEVSAETLRQFTHLSVAKIVADSPQALAALAAFSKARAAQHFTVGTVANSADFNNLPDITTGYVMGWFSQP